MYADNKTSTSFVFSLPDEEFGESVFKITDCPRNVVNSTIPPDKEDLICIFVQKNATLISLPFQCKITKKLKRAQKRKKMH